MALARKHLNGGPVCSAGIGPRLILETNLRFIAALIFIMLCIACWFWIRPIRFTHDTGDNRAEQMEQRHS